MAKKEKTWIIRGTVRRFKKENLGETISVVIAVDSFQSGNKPAYRYEKAKPWIDLSTLEKSYNQLSSQEFYLGEELVVWVTETSDEEENRTYSLKRIEEKTMEIMSVGDFLKNCI